MSPDAAVTEAVAKYFYFSCLDEQLSFAASLKVLAELNSHNRLDAEHRSHWIRTMHKWRPKLQRLRGKVGRVPAAVKAGFQPPEGFDLSIWISFVTATETSEVEALLLSRILLFSDEEIAEGLGVTTGTVRYRVGRGLRHLGGFIEP